jgi:hypothetical protein
MGPSPTHGVPCRGPRAQIVQAKQRKRTQAIANDLGRTHFQCLLTPHTDKRLLWRKGTERAVSIWRIPTDAHAVEQICRDSFSGVSTDAKIAVVVNAIFK